MLAKFETLSNKNYYFDPYTFSIYDSNKCLLSFDDIEILPETKIQLTRHQNKHYLRRCKIQLGMACNYHCEYCIQDEFRIIEKTNKDIDKLVNYLFDHYDIENIQLWGGEPLIYYKTLKILIPKLREKFPESSIVIISNGSLLTKDKVDLFLKYNITFMMSHDGPAFTKYRNKVDPLNDETFCELWNYFNKQCIIHHLQQPVFHAVITPENCDILKLYDYFSDRVYNPTLSVEGICTLTKQSNDKITQFSIQDNALMSNSLYTIITQYMDYGIRPNSLLRYIKPIIENIKNKTKFDLNKTRCGNSDNDILVVDLDGNILACQGTRINNGTKIYQITDNDQNKHQLYQFKRSKCKNCSMISICKQGCPLLDNQQLQYYCKNMFIWSSTLFGVAFRILTGEIITEISYTCD